ncbi:MAG: HD domain-containing protein [Candidatus Marinimicrobia bacterium]|nr:HD domain-containing protein [Candidatus Neomarinimicrobiota bacterium]
MSEFINPFPTSLLTRRHTGRLEDVRGSYFRDQTAIIHSLAFRRLKHKTQVFFSPENDHICTRIEHSLHVASISATICKALKLDTELAHAIGLGHDLGHAPFGHAGESALNRLMEKPFIHEVHSLRVADKLENYGKGLNLTFAVRDGIISHCGEVDEQFVEVATAPNNLDEAAFRPTSPNTWEACVVRISDSIAYLGRDLEDAIKANLITADDIPKNIRSSLGVKNSDIINKLVFDVIDWSKTNDKIGFSPEMFNLLKAFKRFSRTHIYDNPKMDYWNSYSETVLKSIYRYLCQLFKKNQADFEAYAASKTALDNKFGNYIKALQEIYSLNGFDRDTILTDYIAGMTDSYALHCFENILTTGTTGL